MHPILDLPILTISKLISAHATQASDAAALLALHCTPVWPIAIILPRAGCVSDGIVWENPSLTCFRPRGGIPALFLARGRWNDS